MINYKREIVILNLSADRSHVTKVTFIANITKTNEAPFDVGTFNA